MLPGYSKLLIHDMIIPERGASTFHAILDMAMMAFNAGMERTEGQWRELLGRAGFEVVKFWLPAQEDADGIVEAMVIRECVVAGKLLYFDIQSTGQRHFTLEAPCFNFPLFGSISPPTISVESHDHLPQCRLFSWLRSGPPLSCAWTTCASTHNTCLRGIFTVIHAPQILFVHHARRYGPARLPRHIHQ